MDMKMKPYLAIATGNEVGMIEVVLNAETTAGINKVIHRWWRDKYIMSDGCDENDGGDMMVVMVWWLWAYDGCDGYDAVCEWLEVLVWWFARWTR